MRVLITAAASLLVWAASASAQDIGNAEIMVTAQRRDGADFSDDMPAVGLRKNADFLIKEITVSGDTRDGDDREDEIFAMIEGALKLADRHGVQMARGDLLVQPLTLQNFRDLTLSPDRRRPDAEFVTFLVKAPLGEGTSASDAEKRIDTFVESVPEVGRAQMDADGEATFSVVAPDSYRVAIAAKIVADAQEMSGKLGDQYAVEIEGLNMPVQWSRSGLTEVFLYIPYRLTIVPRP